MLTDALIALQIFVVAFIALHDWVPLDGLNDVRAVQATYSPGKLMAVTALSTLPFAVGLAGSVAYVHARLPDWLTIWLWASYGMCFYGLLRAWWIPYLLTDEPVRAQRYQAMFGRTHAFLPMRNGIRPNTLHVVLHIVIVVILVLLVLTLV